MTQLQRFKVLTAVLALALALVSMLAFSSQGKMQAGQDQFDESLPKTISYQGHVEVDGEAFTGEGQFKFAIVDDGPLSPFTSWTNDGTGREGSEPMSAVPLTVTEGAFSVLLGEEQPGMTEEISHLSFEGPKRILRVWFSHDGGANFEELLPPSRLSSVPFAMQAENARTVGNMSALDIIAFSKEENNPNFTRVAKVGGELSSIQAAIDITFEEASADNPYLIYVEPGVYEEKIVMKPYVSIQGSGTEATIIRWKSDSMQGNSAAVTGASNASLSNLSIEAAPANADTPNVQPIAIYNNGASPILSDLDIRSTGGDTAIGISNRNASEPRISDTQVLVGNQATAVYGIHNAEESNAIIDSVEVDARNAETTVGVFNLNSSPKIRNSEVTAAGGDYTRGILNRDGATPIIKYSEILAFAGAKQNFGILGISYARLVLSESTVSAFGPGTSLCTGLSNQDSSVNIVGATVFGDPHSVCGAGFGISNLLSEDNTGDSSIRVERSTVDAGTVGVVSGSDRIEVDVSFSEIGGSTAFDAPSATCFFVRSSGTASNGPDCP